MLRDGASRLRPQSIGDGPDRQRARHFDPDPDGGIVGQARGIPRGHGACCHVVIRENDRANQPRGGAGPAVGRAARVGTRPAPPAPLAPVEGPPARGGLGTGPPARRGLLGRPGPAARRGLLGRPGPAARRALLGRPGPAARRGLLGRLGPADDGDCWDDRDRRQRGPVEGLAPPVPRGPVGRPAEPAAMSRRISAGPNRWSFPVACGIRLAPCAPEGTCVTPPGPRLLRYRRAVRRSSSRLAPGPSSASARPTARSATPTRMSPARCLAASWRSTPGRTPPATSSRPRHSNAYPDWAVTITCAATGDVAACGGVPRVPSSNSCCAISDYGAAACTAAGVAHSLHGGELSGRGRHRRERRTAAEAARAAVVMNTSRIGLGAMLGLLALGCGSKDLELPACVKNLVAACATAGTCTSEGTDAGAVSELCFASGVRASFTGEFAGAVRPQDRERHQGRRLALLFVRDLPDFAARSSSTSGKMRPARSSRRGATVLALGRRSRSCARTAAKRRRARPLTTAPSACCDLTDLGNATCVSPVSCTSGTCP